MKISNVSLAVLKDDGTYEHIAEIKGLAELLLEADDGPEDVEDKEL